MNWEPIWTTKERYLSIESYPEEKWIHFTQWREKLLKDYYWISNLGRLKSYCHQHARYKCKILPGTLDLTTGGYVNTQVRTDDSSQVSMAYHQAEAYYFIGQPPLDMINPVVDHINSDKLDNRCTNLQWLSSSDNTRKAIREGKCSVFCNNGGWNKMRCYFQEYPDILFDSLLEASIYIGRNTDYVGECLRYKRPVKDAIRNNIVHVVIVEGNNVRTIEC